MIELELTDRTFRLANSDCLQFLGSLKHKLRGVRRSSVLIVIVGDRRTNARQASPKSAITSIDCSRRGWEFGEGGPVRSAAVSAAAPSMTQPRVASGSSSIQSCRRSAPKITKSDVRPRPYAPDVILLECPVASPAISSTVRQATFSSSWRPHADVASMQRLPPRLMKKLACRNTVLRTVAFKSSRRNLPIVATPVAIVALGGFFPEQFCRLSF